VWTLNVPYVVQPTAMVDDADEPFTVGSDALKALTPWHDALADYAAGELEQLRKDLERAQYFRAKAETRVLDYLDKQRPTLGRSLTVRTSYRREARTIGGQWISDGPRRW